MGQAIDFFVKLLLFMFLFSCKDYKNEEKLPIGKFRGYGVIQYGKSFAGSVRYMTFYPVMEAKKPDSILASKLKIKVDFGIVIRGKNKTKLWQDLYVSNILEPDDYGYYRSLIYIDLSENELEYNYEKKIPHGIIIEGREFTTKTFDYTFNEEKKLRIKDYVIFKSLK